MNATVMAHYYQDIEVQGVADFIGDSLQLARYAAESKADVIVFVVYILWLRVPKFYTRKTCLCQIWMLVVVLPIQHLRMSLVCSSKS